MSSRQTIVPQQPHPTHQSPFFAQRDALVADIAMAMEHVLQNINKLNRSLEGVIAVGNEFGAVEALWSHFEDVMAKEPGEGQKNGDREGSEGVEEEEEEEGDEDGAEQDEQATGGKDR